MSSSPRSPRRLTARHYTALVIAGLLVPALAQPTVAAPQPQLPRAATGTDDDRGVWQVEQVGGGFYEVRWTSPTPLPLSSDRPTITSRTPDGISVASLGADGRTVSATVAADSAPDPATLDVRLSGDRLDEAGRDQVAASSSPTPAASTTTAVADPALPGPHAVVSSAYELAPEPIEGFNEPVEVVGHVVEPAPDAVTGPRPLVLFLHGRHSVCYVPGSGSGEGEWPCAAPEEEIPSHLGYRYVQRLLASQGYATVSIRVNGINAQDYAHEDGGADARAVLVQRHLDHWVGLAAAHQVDLSRTVLVGHSRGGEGVNRASIRIPLSAPYRIVGQVLIAPTNFGNQAAPYVPTVTLLPYCDGDVIDLQGQRFTDVARDVVTGDPSLKSSVMVMGANHNFFNTEWTPGIAQAPSWDDWFGDKDAACGKATPERLSAKEQRAVGRAYVAGAVGLFASNAEEYLPLYDGSPVVPPSTADADVRSHAIGGGRTLRRPALDTSLTLPVGAETQFCLGRIDFRGAPDSCGRTDPDSSSTPHWPSRYELVPLRREFEMTWTAPGQVGGMEFDRNLDLTGRRLELRTIVDPNFGSVQLDVRLTDADGAQAVLTPDGGGQLPVLLEGGYGMSKRWAQPLLVDPAGAAIDVSRVARIELVGGSDDGRVWVLDVASAPASLTAVPDTRVPLIDIAQVEIDEGDGGRVTGRVPFTITGGLTQPAKFSVITTGEARGSRYRFTVDLAPGQTSGGIPIEYLADTRDDYPRTTYYVAGFVGRNVMMDRYLGGLTILDDDPEPVVTVRPVERTVAEGDSAIFEVRLSARTDYDLFFRGRVAAGPWPVVRTGDVAESWLRRHVFGKGDASTPLHQRNTFIFERVRAGSRTTWVSVPIAVDDLAEPRESLTLRFRINDQTFVRTIWVAR